MALDEREFTHFKQQVLMKTGIDLNGYKEKQMKRRIDALITRVNLDSYDDYFLLLGKDEHRYREFLDRLTINVSEFFRNGSRWDALRDKIIPRLFDSRGLLKVWSAACSTGEEPYSLAMLLAELGCLPVSSLLASDLDDTALARAQAGLFQARAVATVPASLRDRYFTRTEDGFLINDRLRKTIQFRHHDLITERYSTDFDLIVCRNVMIYFTEEAKANIYRKFHQSLRPGGVLFVGSTEQIFNAKGLGYEAIAPFFYQKSM